MRMFLLPHLPHKVCRVTSRLVTYNETFSPVGRKIRRERNPSLSVSVARHEGTTGREDADVTSAFFRVPETVRRAEAVVLWIDNCTAQNKNWKLLTGLLQAINRKDLNLRQVTLIIQKRVAHPCLQKQFTKFATSSSRGRKWSPTPMTSKRHFCPRNDTGDGLPGHRQRRQRSEAEAARKLEGSIIRGGLQGGGGASCRGQNLLFTKANRTAKTWQTFDVMKNGFTPTEQQPKRKSPRGVNKEKLRKLKQTLQPMIPLHSQRTCVLDNTHSSSAVSPSSMAEWSWERKHNAIDAVYG